MTREPIAIVGIGCRFPAGDGPRQFWRSLADGRDAIRDVAFDRASDDASFVAPSVRGGWLDAIDGFDWRAFRIPPREAKYLDPQHRLLLEVSWEALEDAGVPFDDVAGSETGVFVSLMWNDYLRLQTRDPASLTGYSMTGSGFAFAPNRVSYAFDLRGPSMAVDAACAGSLASIHLACQSLWADECDMALAGGVNLIVSRDVDSMLDQTGVLSPNGRCRTFDAGADGFVRGEGAGVIVLKRQSDVAPSDRVYALIAGSALNHNGHNEWIMAASSDGQGAVLEKAYRNAGVDPGEVDYVELHGTGLPKGDPIEAGALGATLGTADGRSRPLRVGSVKTNIGHLDSAAGVASVIKVALALREATIPASLNLDTVNPAIDLDALGLEVQTKTDAWPDTARRLAGVSAISMSGVNAHVVLGSADPIPRTTQPDAAGRSVIVPISAHDPAALVEGIERLRDRLWEQPDTALEDIGYTMAMRRTHHEHRAVVIAGSIDELQRGLDTLAAAEAGVAGVIGSDPSGLADRFIQGEDIDWSDAAPDGVVIDLPTTAWQRQRLWIEGLVEGSVGVEQPNPPTTELVSELDDVPVDRRQSILAEHVRGRVAGILGLDVGDVGAHIGFFDLGMTSLSAVELAEVLGRDVGVSFPATLAFDYPTVEALSRHLATIHASRASSDGDEPAARDTSTAYVDDLSEEEAEALLMERLKDIRGE